jgi:hypothetical protein
MIPLDVRSNDLHKTHRREFSSGNQSVLHFIFDDDRYREASDSPSKLLMAFLIIMEFPIQFIVCAVIGGTVMVLKQLIIFIKYVSVLFIISACCVMIYSNALFSVAVVGERLSPFSRINWVDAVFCVALACSVAVWLPVYVMVAAARPKTAALKETDDAASPKGASVWGAVRLRAGSAIAVATVVLFFVHWNVYGRYGALIRNYDVMPQKVMEISAGLVCRFRQVTTLRRRRCAEAWGAAMTSGAAISPGAANSRKAQGEKRRGQRVR